MNTRPAVPVYLPYSLGALWLWSGLQPLLAARQEFLDLLAAVGFQTAFRYPVLLAASLLDVLFGLLCFSRAPAAAPCCGWRRRRRWRDTAQSSPSRCRRCGCTRSRRW